MTSSAAGIYGNFGQCNYSSAKMALIGFCKSLAFEGQKRNIYCNTIAPIAFTRFTQDIMSEELIDLFKPNYIVPLTLFLCHEINVFNGLVFETGAGSIREIVWQRSAGAYLNVELSNLSVYHVEEIINQARNFNKPEYPKSIKDTDWIDKIHISKSMGQNSHFDGEIEFKNKVILITGSGAGLGKQYALYLASKGAKIIINDPSKDSRDIYLADLIVDEINEKFGKESAISNYEFVENAEKIFDQSIKHFGKVDVLINNAGILRDRSFLNMNDKEWNSVINVHLHGTFAIIKLFWNYMIGRKSGRIVNTTSAVGLYGNFGQTNYSAAKSAIIGLTMTLAAEGASHNIYVNCIAPNAGTAMTATILTEDIVKLLKPEFVAPFMAFLCHESCKSNGEIFEVGSGWIAKVRPEQRTLITIDPEFLTMEHVTHKMLSEGNGDHKLKAIKILFPSSARESILSFTLDSQEIKGKNLSISNIISPRIEDVELLSLVFDLKSKSGFDFQKWNAFIIMNYYFIYMISKIPFKVICQNSGIDTNDHLEIYLLEYILRQKYSLENIFQDFDCSFERIKFEKIKKSYNDSFILNLNAVITCPVSKKEFSELKLSFKIVSSKHGTLKVPNNEYTLSNRLFEQIFESSEKQIKNLLMICHWFRELERFSIKFDNIPLTCSVS